MRIFKELPFAAVVLIIVAMFMAGGWFIETVQAQSDNFGPMNGLEAPAISALAITPSDTVNLSSVCRGVYVGGDGTMVVVMKSNEVVTFAGVPAGSVIPIRIKRVNSTSTTATNLVCMW